MMIVASGRFGDITPEPVNWANISGAAGTSNAAQTITGLTAPINLRASWSGGDVTLQYVLNAAAGVSITNGVTDIPVTNNDTLAFKMVAGPDEPKTITVSNNSAGGAPTLDTFTVREV